jgi:hypothetical protein
MTPQSVGGERRRRLADRAKIRGGTTTEYATVSGTKTLICSKKVQARYRPLCTYNNTGNSPG